MRDTLSQRDQKVAASLRFFGLDGCIGVQIRIVINVK